MATNNNLFINQTDVVSLGTASDEPEDLDYILKIFVKTSNNLRLELKYPNFNRLNANLLLEYNHLKNVYFKVHPNSAKNVSNKLNLCQQMLGLYTNIGYDAFAKEFKLIVQGFSSQKSFAYQQQIRIGDMLIAINDIPVNTDNIDALLLLIKQSQTLKLAVLTPLTYVNLNTNERLLKNIELDIFKSKRKASHSSNSSANTNKIIANSKSTTVVKGDRVKSIDQNVPVDDLFMFIMILSLNKQTLKKQTSRDKNDLVYKYPNAENQLVSKKFSVANTIQMIETVRGLFMTLAFAVKDIDKNDEAVCSSIQYQDQLYEVAFLGENYGNNGQMVLIMPSEQIDIKYFKLIAKNLNTIFKFTFGSVLPKLLNTNNENFLLDLNIVQDINELNSIKTEMDTFFSQFNKRITRSTLFYLFDEENKLFKSHFSTNENAGNKLISLNRIELFDEMKGIYMNSIPYLDLPDSLRTDLDTILIDLEAQEFVDLENNFYRYRRLFLINGSCLFYKDYLVANHLNDSTTRNIYNFCVHYNLFGLTKNGNPNQFQIWKEVDLKMVKNSDKSMKDTSSRHFLIIIGLRQFVIAVILESGGAVSRQFEKNKTVEPDPFYISRVTSVLNDIYDNGIMNEIDRFFTFDSQRQIVLNLNKFVTQSKPKQKVKGSVSMRARSNSRSPMRITMSVNSNGGIKKRSNSNDTRKVYANKTGDQHQSCFAGATSQENASTLNLNTEYAEYCDPGKASLNEANKAYHSRKPYRHLSLSDLTSGKTITHQVLRIESTTNRYFHDISLNESIIYYASTENKLNGILFAPRKFDLNSGLFGRMFYNYVKSCFKIKHLFESFKLIQRKRLKDSKQEFELIEQGVLFKLYIIGDDLKLQINNNRAMLNERIDRQKMKELNFWVVGRRKLKRVADEWVNLGDLFICFHDSVEDILVELAFDIGFAKMSF